MNFLHLCIFLILLLQYLHGDDDGCLLTLFVSENPLHISGSHLLIFAIYGGTMILVNLLKHSTDWQFGVFVDLIFWLYLFAQLLFPLRFISPLASTP